jgi:hypothetical protein
MLDKMDPDRDQAVDQLALAASPRAGIFRLKGDEHYSRVDGTNSPI